MLDYILPSCRSNFVFSFSQKMIHIQIFTPQPGRERWDSLDRLGEASQQSNSPVSARVPGEKGKLLLCDLLVEVISPNYQGEGRRWVEEHGRTERGEQRREKSHGRACEGCSGHSREDALHQSQERHFQRGEMQKEEHQTNQKYILRELMPRQKC